MIFNIFPIILKPLLKVLYLSSKMLYIKKITIFVADEKSFSK